MEEEIKLEKLSMVRKNFPDKGDFFPDFYVNYFGESSEESSNKHEVTSINNPEKSLLKITRKYPPKSKESTQFLNKKTHFSNFDQGRQDLDENKKINLISNEDKKDLKDDKKINSSLENKNDIKEFNKEDKINIIKIGKDNSNKIHKTKKNNQIFNEIKNDSSISTDYINNQNSNNKSGYKNTNIFISLKIKIHDNKYNDNLIKKIKSFYFKLFISHGNKIIRKCQKIILKTKSILSLEEKKELKYERLVQINSYQANNTNVNFNKILLGKTIKDILSVSISKKKCYNINHNKYIIKKIYNEHEIARKFFDTKFEDIINYINKKYNDPKEIKKIDKEESEERKEFMKTYQIELAKRDTSKKKDRKFIEENIKNFVKIIKERKSK